MNENIKNGIEYVTVTRSGFEMDRKIIESLSKQKEYFLGDREALVAMLNFSIETIEKFSPKIASEFRDSLSELQKVFQMQMRAVMASDALDLIQAQRMLKLLESRNAGDMSPFPQDRVQEE